MKKLSEMDEKEIDDFTQEIINVYVTNAYFKIFPTLTNYTKGMKSENRRRN